MDGRPSYVFFSCYRNPLVRRRARTSIHESAYFSDSFSSDPLGEELYLGFPAFRTLRENPPPELSTLNAAAKTIRPAWWIWDANRAISHNPSAAK